MLYPCMQDYIKDENIAFVEQIFREIANESEDIFSDYDFDLFDELGSTFYYDNSRKPLKTLYYYRFKGLDLSDTEGLENFFKRIGKIAYSRFGDNWEAIYKAYFATPYRPLENYDMEQVRTPLLDTTNTTTRKQDTKVETGGTTSVVPFNSTTPTQTSASTGESETTEEKTKNEIEGKVEERGTDTLTRHGNIGVTTSQQMLQSELDLRKLDFQKLIFRDIEKILFRDYWPL